MNAIPQNTCNILCFFLGPVLPRLLPEARPSLYTVKPHWYAIYVVLLVKLSLRDTVLPPFLLLLFSLLLPFPLDVFSPPSLPPPPFHLLPPLFLQPPASHHTQFTCSSSQLSHNLAALCMQMNQFYCLGMDREQIKSRLKRFFSFRR